MSSPHRNMILLTGNTRGRIVGAALYPFLQVLKNQGLLIRQLERANPNLIHCAGELKLNIECNHATLSGHSCRHELETARINGLLGYVDANTGDPQVGWDTYQFLLDVSEATLVMLSVIKTVDFHLVASILMPNYEEKVQMLSIYIYIYRRGLRNAAKLIEDGSLAELVRKRYKSFDSEFGALIEAGKVDFDMLEKKAMEWGEPQVRNGKQELAEMIFQSPM